LVIVVLLAVGLVVATILSGCTVTGTLKGTCALQPIGQDERGIQVVRYYCQPDES